jgi:hypothetical protein
VEHALFSIVLPLKTPSHCSPLAGFFISFDPRHIYLTRASLHSIGIAKSLKPSRSSRSMEDSSSAMETESHAAPDSEFAHSPWVELGNFTSPHNSPPIPEYSGFDYGPSPLMAVDATYGMSIPPPYASMPLPMPSHSWPSMLTHQSAFHESGLPPVSVPTSVSPSAPTPPIRKTSTGGATPRRTLTDEDRRQMCLYHEENKQAKQTDIGGKIGNIGALLY